MDFLNEHKTTIISIIGIVIGSFVIKRVILYFIGRFVRKAIKPDRFSSKAAEVQREDTLIHIARGSLTVVIWITAGMMILNELGIEIGPLLASAGVAGVALGFGGQWLIRDLIAGLFIVMENQYRVGDVVSLDGTAGLVEDITLRMTTLRDLDGTVHLIPNGTINRASNLSKDYSGVNINLGVAYRTDLDQAIGVINGVGLEQSKDKQWRELIITPLQVLRIDHFGDSAIEIKVTGKTKPLEQWAVMGEFRLRIKRAFDKAGIEIPFPQRVIHQPTDS
jgi:moderate conductance mechanosensitive channel